jgi:hypothetical protein
MEQQNPESSLFDLKVDENTKEQLRGLSKWTMIVVITTIISLVLSLIQALMVKKDTIEYGSYRLQSQKSPNIGSVIISLIISGLLAYLLYQFSVSTKKGVDNMSQEDLNKGLGSLKSYFMVYGIIIIIVMAIVLVALLIVGTTNVLR